MSPLLRWGLLGSLGASLLVLVAVPEPAANAHAEAEGLLTSRVRLPEGGAAAAQPRLQPPLEPSSHSAAWPAPRATALAAWASTPKAAAQQAGPLRGAAAAAPVRNLSPAVPAAASAPATPSFPYRYIGHLEDGQGTRVFIASAQQLWAVQPGQTLDRQWRLDGFEQGQLQLTWLPDGSAVSVPTR